MTTIDFRTRFQGDTEPLNAEWLLDGLPDVLRETGALAARGVQVLGLSTFGVDVDGVTAHLAVDQGALVVREGDAADGPIAVLDADAFSELMQDVTSTFGLTLAGRVQLRRGSTDDFTAWEPVLRAISDERPVYEPGSIEFRARDGSALDVPQSFRLEDPHEDIGQFLAQAGFLHLQSVFTEDEMAAVSADLDAATAAAEQDDGQSWWARTPDGWYPSRILGFNLKSPALRELLDSDRFRAIGTFTDDVLVQRNPHEGDSAEGLDKKVDVVEGISDVSWHKDCSLGGHSRRCSGITVGISVTGAQADCGELGVVAGSHRANVQLVNLRHDLDLPRIPLPTQTGDITVHCSCTLHMSRPPVSKGRRVVYTGFGLAPRDGDITEDLSPEEIRRRRAALDGQTRDLQHRTDFGNDVETFELEATT